MFHSLTTPALGIRFFVWVSQHIINNILNGQRMEQKFETGTRWSIVDDSIWEPPLWSVIVSTALGAATAVLATCVDNDIRALYEARNLPLEELPLGKVFIMSILGSFAAAFTFANAVLLFRNVRVWLRRISINNKSTYKFRN